MSEVFQGDSMSRFMSPLRPRYLRDSSEIHPHIKITSITSTAHPPANNTLDSNEQQIANEEQSLSEQSFPESSCIAEGTFRQIRDYSLVLLSQGVEHRLDRSEEGPFQIFVLPEFEEFARDQIALYQKENPPKEENLPQPLSFSLQPLWIFIPVLIATLLDFADVVNLHLPGVSDASKVLKGQWWRSLTALTLHGDARHLASNILCGYIVMNMITYRIPLLRLAPFLAISSAVANICVSMTVKTNFSALGFSTFVFAAIGCLAVMEFRLMPRESHGLLRRFAPLCGATSLAVFLGLGENADILGHGYGFIAGLFCGLIPTKKALRWGTPVTFVDIVGLAVYYGLFAIAWTMAL